MFGRNVRRMSAALAVAAAFHLMAPVPAAAGPPRPLRAAAEDWLTGVWEWISGTWSGLGATWAAQDGGGGGADDPDGNRAGTAEDGGATGPDGTPASAQGDTGMAADPDG